MITTDEAERIGVMAARLAGSDGQVLHAARTLVATLDRHGLRIGDLLADLLRPRSPAVGAGDAPHARAARACIARPWHFSAYELQFLFDVTHLPKLSERQQAKLDRLASRLR